MQAGIDEAGRGPVVGPLVVALVGARNPATLAALGVRDSKQLSPARREGLAPAIRAVAERVETVALSAADLDARMIRQSLNDIEVDLFVELGRRVPAEAYYLDACDVDEHRFRARFLHALDREGPRPRVVSEHRADERYPVVSAASIIAKVARDEAVRDIARRLEPRVGLPLGSGYPSDAATLAFLARHLELFGRLPEEARGAWATSRALIQARSQRRLPGL